MILQLPTLFDSLEKEFCPPLDTSLIAALLVEIELDADGQSNQPTQDQIDNLRATLSALAEQADETQLTEFSDGQLISQFEETISSWTTPDQDQEQSANATSRSSGSSESSQHSFNSPLGFLQAALPDIPSTRLRKALEEWTRDDADMWDIISGVLTEESIREMEERGLDGLEGQEGYPIFIPEEVDWETVATKKKIPPKAGKRKTQPRAHKVSLLDIRQQHHVRPTAQSAHRRSGSNIKYPTGGIPADPWTQVSSLSAHVATLVPPHPPSVFQSFFHSPDYATSYDALRAALTSLCITAPQDTGNHTTVLFNLLDVIMPEYEDSDVEQRSRIISDIELAIVIADGRGDDALDIVSVLRDLDSDSDMGIYHLRPPQPVVSYDILKTNGVADNLPSGPPPVPPPPPLKGRQNTATPSSSGNKPSPFQWQAVPQRKFIDRSPHPLAHHIPAYSRDVNGKKTHRDMGKNSIKFDSETYEFRRRMSETMRKRNELLREASRMWQKGNSKSRGGEVALYFAERAKEYQELARQEALNAARVMVLSKRGQDTVDLHGTTVIEATTIIREILKDQGLSISQGMSMHPFFPPTFPLSVFSFTMRRPTSLSRKLMPVSCSRFSRGSNSSLWRLGFPRPFTLPFNRDLRYFL
ncbi:hypothetical protein B0H34DRAFT_420004 [Crassisporium funariophilum]|nr:hypothetical protein B0H34DRAFT_420004 [Crassisporium funariophilum]